MDVPFPLAATRSSGLYHRGSPAAFERLAGFGEGHI